MSTDTSEKAFQRDIYTYLESTGYVKRTTKDYNVATCLDVESYVMVLGILVSLGCFILSLIII